MQGDGCCIYEHIYSFYIMNDGSFVMMDPYTVLRIAMLPLFFALTDRIAQRYHFSHSLSIGLFLLSVQLVSVLYLNDCFSSAPCLVFTVAVIDGIEEGFFWCCATGFN